MIAYLKTLTPGQWMAVIIGVLSATAGASAQLTPVFGSALANTIVSIANLIMTVVVTPFLFVITGQSAQIKAVNAMPGVNQIIVNEKANSALASIAVDPNSKVEAAPESKTAVEQTAKDAQ